MECSEYYSIQNIHRDNINCWLIGPKIVFPSCFLFRKMRHGDKLEVIQGKIEELSKKRLSLFKNQNEAFLKYKQENSVYGMFFGKHPVQTNREIDAIDSEINDLREEKKEIYKTIQVLCKY